MTLPCPTVISAPAGSVTTAAAVVRCWTDLAQPKVACVRLHRYDPVVALSVGDRPATQKETNVPFSGVLAAHAALLRVR